MSEQIVRVDRNLLEDSDFDRFQKQAVMTVARHLEDKSNGPLITIDEDDLLIDSPAVYFTRIEQVFTPINARHMVRENIMTEAEVVRRRNAGKAIIRATKSDMYAERMLTATYATDQCRSLYRFMTKGDLIPVAEVDTEESLHAWVGDYVSDVLRAGRETRLLRGSAMATTTEGIRSKFDEGNQASQLVLTVLAGMNSRKKINLWLDSLQKVSKNFERMNKETKEKVMQFLLNRPPEYFDTPDLIQIIADIKHKS